MVQPALSGLFRGLHVPLMQRVFPYCADGRDTPRISVLRLLSERVNVVDVVLPLSFAVKGCAVLHGRSFLFQPRAPTGAPNAYRSLVAILAVSHEHRGALLANACSTDQTENFCLSFFARNACEQMPWVCPVGLRGTLNLLAEANSMWL